MRPYAPRRAPERFRALELPAPPSRSATLLILSPHVRKDEQWRQEGQPGIWPPASCGKLLALLFVRDQTANSLATALDFTRPSLSAPRYDVPPALPVPSPSRGSSAGEKWSANLTLATQFGWHRL